MKICQMSCKRALMCLLVPLCIFCGYEYARVQELTADLRNQSVINKYELNNQNAEPQGNKSNGEAKRNTREHNLTSKEPIHSVKGKNSDEGQRVVFAVFNKLSLPLFQPLEEVEFPTGPGVPRIPHIIHQIYTNETVPEMFAANMKTFVKHNPKWVYRFWSYESGRKLIEERYSYLLHTYTSFTDSVKKADMLRYVLLYEFGGVYADLDVENLRPLDKATIKYPCILPTEPFEHSGLFFQDGSFIIMSNSILLCRPKHPFFLKVLHSLYRVLDLDASPIGLTGPDFLSEMLMEYNSFSRGDITGGKLKINDNTNSPYFYRGSRNPEDDDGIYVPNSQYFMDYVDPGLVNVESNILNACMKFGEGSPFSALRACAEYESRKGIRKRKTYTFMIHYWKHLWTMSKGDINSLPTKHIHEIIPEAILWKIN